MGMIVKNNQRKIKELKINLCVSFKESSKRKEFPNVLFSVEAQYTVKQIAVTDRNVIYCLGHVCKSILFVFCVSEFMHAKFFKCFLSRNLFFYIYILCIYKINNYSFQMDFNWFQKKLLHYLSL